MFFFILMIFSSFSFLDAHSCDIVVPIQFNTLFSGHEVPLRKMHSLTMEVWGTVDAYTRSVLTLEGDSESQFHRKLASRILLINSMFDMFRTEIVHQQCNTEYMEHIRSDVIHIHNVLVDVHKNYQRIFDPSNGDMSVVIMLLELLVVNIVTIITGEMIISPYYAVNHYPKTFMPWSVLT